MPPVDEPVEEPVEAPLVDPESPLATQPTPEGAAAAGAAAAEATSTGLPQDGPGLAVPELEDALRVQPDLTAGAFFDVDNTVMRGASIFHLARGLYERDFFTLRDILGFARQQISFVLRGENMEDVDEIQAKALSFVAGHSVTELRAVGEEVFDQFMADKIWPGTRALAQMHLDAGQRVWLVTATPVEVAEVIASRLGLTGGLGTVAEHVDGVYTGKLVGSLLHGPAKVEAVRALAEREGLDLQRCSAYSDSANDIPLLSLVGHPCAVNPDKRLRSYAKAHGWRVRDYRTGRKAARIGIPAAALAGALVGVVMGALAANRRFRHPKR
jgi:HAD superfamily hydrolase (TIGR01490 family)